MTYALPTNVTGIGSLVDYIVSIDPNFFNILLVGIFFIIYIGLRASPNLTNPIAFTTASFGTTLSSILLGAGGYVGFNTILYSIAILIVGFILLFIEAK